MRNVLRVLARDILRLLKTPAAWSVLLFLTVLPSLYTWFNVAGFWNPYDNTGALRVCVVNEDEGAEVDGIGSIDLGSQIVGQLQGNDQLGWAFVSREQAEDEVRAGIAYAAFIMPADFSSDVASIVTGAFHQPEIEYYVNEKVGPVAPKITDTGASALDSTINEAFVSTVSEAVASLANEKIDDVEQAAQDARSEAVSKVEAARRGVADTRAGLAAFAQKAEGARADALDAKSRLEGAKAQLDALSGTIGLVSKLAGNAAASLVKFSTTANSTLDDASQAVSQSAARADAAVAKDANAVFAAKGDIDGAIARCREIAREAGLAATDLGEIEKALATDAGSPEIGDAARRARELAKSAEDSLASLQQLANDVEGAANSARKLTSAVDDAVQQGTSSAGAFRSTMSSSVVPSVSAGLTQVSGIAAGLSAQSASQQAIVDEALGAVDELAAMLQTTAAAVTASSERLAGIEGELSALEDDLAALGTSSSLAEAFRSARIDPATIADFMMSPTQLETEGLYPLNAYGSAMAPLFINLTLWIGVFMLMVIMRLEVDDEGVEKLTITERFFARLLLLAPLACMQAAVCCTGCLWLGVQSASVGAFYLTAIMASLAYLAIQYTLSTSLQHVGKALCIILVFVQIPGASGIYPIEMTPAFFRVVYPLFPFTYGINAMRETISGFYDGQWLSCMATLCAFMAIFLFIGVVARPYLTNLNRMFAREIEESDMIVGENVELPARRWRLSQVIRALSDRDEYRTALERRARLFMSLYPRIKTASLFAGIAVPVLTVAVLMPLGADKVVILTTWLAWLVAIVTFLLVIELVRDNLIHQFSLEAMDADEMRSLVRSRYRLTRVKPLDRELVPEEVPAASAPDDAGQAAAAHDAQGPGSQPMESPDNPAPPDAPENDADDAGREAAAEGDGSEPMRGDAL